MQKANLDSIFASFHNGVAHRGLHDEVRPENSKAAFAHAMELGLPFETDVHLTADHRLVINHDHELGRVTGKDGGIEKLTLQEIKDNYRLKDGSQLMEMGELLSFWGEKVPMVLEIKEYFGNGEDIKAALKPLLDPIKDLSKLVLISFSANALRIWKEEKWNRGLLIGGGEIDHPSSPNDFEFLDVDFTLLSDPRLLAYKNSGQKVLSWTIHDENSLSIARAHSDAMTFEILPPERLQGN